MDIMFFIDNQRKTHGLPLWRNKNKRKCRVARCGADETAKAFLEYCRK